MLSITGGSFGIQIGGQAVDVVMLVMNKRGMSFLVGDKFTIGGDASVAAGPVGRATSAETNAALRAEILAYSRARGLFAGVSLKGALVKPDDDANRDLYGRELSAKTILLEGKAVMPPEAQQLISALAKYR
jgi:lipid-binding SYLF domain-containing protein